MSDGRHPHRRSAGTLDAERDGAWIIGWECAECGAWIREFGPMDTSECPIDWRGSAT